MGRFGLLECQEQDHRSGDPTFCIWLCVFCPWFQTNIYGLQDQFDNCSIAHNAALQPRGFLRRLEAQR